MQFTAEELAPIEAALRDVPEGDARASALIKMAHFAHVADKALAKGEGLPATEDALQKAVGAAVESARKREGLAKREAGSPLSAAELEQRREAAKSRGDGGVSVVQTAAVGAGAGALVNVAPPKTIATAMGAADRAMQRMDARANKTTGKGYATLRDLEAGTSRASKLRMMARPAGIRASLRVYGAAAKRGAKVGALIGGGLALNAALRRASERPVEKSLSPAALQKAIAQLPMAHRAHAEDMLKAGRVDDLQKAFPAAIVAAARGLWTAANIAGGASMARDLWRSGAKAASGYASAGRAGLRNLANNGKAAIAGIEGGLAGKGYTAGQARAYGAGRAVGQGAKRAGLAAGRMAGQAAETITSKYGPAAVRGLKSRAGVGLAAGAAAGGAGAAGGAAYGASQERKNNPFTRNQQRGPRPGAPRGV